MPKAKRIGVYIDLLKSQVAGERIYFRVLKWLLSTGRFILIAVEFIVLTAFISRFKLDADIAYVKENIESQIPFLESQKQDENLIRQVQMQLLTIKDIRQNSPNFGGIIKNISSQIPQTTKITNINLARDAGKINVKLSGSATNHSDITAFMQGLREYKNFTDVNLANIGFEQGLINFTITLNI